MQFITRYRQVQLANVAKKVFIQKNTGSVFNSLDEISISSLVFTAFGCHFLRKGSLNKPDKKREVNLGIKKILENKNKQRTTLIENPIQKTH